MAKMTASIPPPMFHLEDQPTVLDRFDSNVVVERRRVLFSTRRVWITRCLVRFFVMCEKCQPRSQRGVPGGSAALPVGWAPLASAAVEISTPTSDVRLMPGTPTAVRISIDSPLPLVAGDRVETPGPTPSGRRRPGARASSRTSQDRLTVASYVSGANPGGHMLAPRGALRAPDANRSRLLRSRGGGGWRWWRACWACSPDPRPSRRRGARLPPRGARDTRRGGRRPGHRPASARRAWSVRRSESHGA
jgi:hypothetical protein